MAGHIFANKQKPSFLYLPPPNREDNGLASYTIPPIQDPAPTLNMLKLFHYVSYTVGRRVVGIRQKYILVTICDYFEKLDFDRGLNQRL